MNQITKIIKEREEELRKEFNQAFPPPMLLGQNQEQVVNWWLSHNKATILAVLETLEEILTKLHYKMAEDYSDAEYRSNYMSEVLSLITLTKQEIKYYEKNN